MRVIGTRGYGFGAGNQIGMIVSGFSKGTYVI